MQSGFKDTIKAFFDNVIRYSTLWVVILSILKDPPQDSFWKAPTHQGIIEFSNFLLQLKI